MSLTQSEALYTGDVNTVQQKLREIKEKHYFRQCPGEEALFFVLSLKYIEVYTMLYDVLHGHSIYVVRLLKGIVLVRLCGVPWMLRLKEV